MDNPRTLADSAAHRTALGYLSAKQAANELECSDAYIRQLCLAGRITGAIKLGRDWLIPHPICVTKPQTMRR